MKITTDNFKVISVLSIGTLLEYFDFYLYLHCASILNKVFFATGDAKSNALLLSFAYLSTFLFRPIGAIIFGYIGDKYGRKYVINITFILMGISCIGICLLPSYEDIGIWASIFITLFRAMQGISSMGEIIGGEIYINEYFKGKDVVIYSTLLILMCNIGCQIALYGIRFSLEGYYNWRCLFIFGISIFILGYYARKNLSETSEFIKSKLIKKNEAKSLKLYLASFFTEIYSSVFFALSVVGINSILREKYLYTEHDIIERNITSVYFNMAYIILFMLMMLKIDIIKIILIRYIIAFCLILLSPFLLDNLTYLIWFQNLICFLIISNIGLQPIIYKNISVLQRFKVCTLNFTISRAIAMIVSSFGIVLLLPYLGEYVFIIFGLPFLIAYGISFLYLIKVNNKNPII